MEAMTWIKQTSPEGEVPMVVSEYVLNDLGIFVKREKRVPKKAKFTALTGFRIGYAAIPGTDYRAAPMDRTAILWHKLTLVKDDGADDLIIKGNRKDTITLIFEPENRSAVIQFIETKRQQHPIVGAEDYVAASWICWRDDDDWGDPQMTLSEMIDLELDTERFLEPEVLAETRLAGVRDTLVSEASAASIERSKFCPKCGMMLLSDGNFCSGCGTRIQP